MSSQDVLPPPLQDSISITEATEPVPIPSSSTSFSASTTIERPNAHTQRYDRQLRLWAKSGQEALENANILIINATATAAQTLKNLVLPGIGSFTLLDSSKVEGSDVGNNFFLTRDSLGKSRGQEVTNHLLELNGDVKGHVIPQDLSSFLASSEHPLSPYSLILAIDVDPNQLPDLSDRAWHAQIPLIKVKSCGFYGSLSVQINELTIVETHPESLIDLRIHHPFPELIAYARTFEYEKMNSAEFGHVPAVVILVKGLEAWKESHDGKGPSTSSERKEFVDSILKQKRQYDDENFDEAVTLFRRAGTKTGIPLEIQKLFDDPCCQNIDASSSNFWLLLHSVRTFTLSNPSHLLPLSGSLPDMKSDTNAYVDLQRLYKSKARSDLFAVQQILEQLLQNLGSEKDRISNEELESFVKHSSYLTILRTRSFSSQDDVRTNLLKGQLGTLFEMNRYEEIPMRGLEIYLAFQSANRFFVEYGKYPGSDEDDLNGLKDKDELVRMMRELINELDGLVEQEDFEECENVCWEICRAAHSDLPQTAALLGGLVAQEAIKIVTKQYVPIDATCIWNGIASGTAIVRA